MDDRIQQIIGQASLENQQALYRLLEKLNDAERSIAGRASFMGFVQNLWHGFIKGWHHSEMAAAFDQILDGSLKRLIINLGPRFTKTEFSSFYLPAKFFGHFPDKKIIQASHTAKFAQGQGRKVRNLVASQEYQDLYPGTQLVQDSKAAGLWHTSRGGEYFAVGVGGVVTGKGADLLIIDDPHTEQDYIRSLGGDSAAFDETFEWYTAGPRQRLQPGAAIVVCMTRWHMRDLTGRLVKTMTTGGGYDQWKVIEFPALLPDTDRPMWPEYWSYEELCATRDEISAAKWNAQYLQNPTSEEGALVKRKWWKIWERDTAPPCDFIIQSWDTAYKRTETSDYNACTTWGVFDMPDDAGKSCANIILLDAFRQRMEFPALKKKALEMWKDRQPDSFLVEAKASGLPLIQEFRQMGIPVEEFTPTRGNDKVVRMNAVSDLFHSGMVWCPDTHWAREVMDEVAAFPAGEHDDYCDSMTQALLRFRRGGFITLSSDWEGEEWYPKRAEYY